MKLEVKTKPESKTYPIAEHKVLTDMAVYNSADGLVIVLSEDAFKHEIIGLLPYDRMCSELIDSYKTRDFGVMFDNEIKEAMQKNY